MPKASKISAQKIILLVLAESKGANKWTVSWRMRFAVAGDLGMSWMQLRRFYGRAGNRPEYDEDRRQKNIVHASISRSLARLVERGLVE
jgi:hypothetical protein